MCHMLNKFDTKRQGEVRVFCAREGINKIGWHYIRFRIPYDLCETSTTVTQRHTILYPRMVHKYVRSKMSFKSLLFKGDAAVGSLCGVIGCTGGISMQRRPPDARTELWVPGSTRMMFAFLYCVLPVSNSKTMQVGQQ
jgi:hypothetical protein